MKTNNKKSKGDGSLGQPFLGSWDHGKVVGGGVLMELENYMGP
jgi:hypothetical protein